MLDITGKRIAIVEDDIASLKYYETLLRETGAAGLMLGRGAIADPLLFERLRGRATPAPDRDERRAQLEGYLQDMVMRYSGLFCGDMQVLGKLKAIVSQMDDPELVKTLKELKKAKTLRAFAALLGGTL